jgi:hypothetical protein
VMKFDGGYPIVQGYRDSVVVGYRVRRSCT